MEFESIQDVTAVVGVVIAIVGFAAVILQLRQVERGLRSSARGSIYDMGSRMKEVFMAHPNMRSYFFDGQEIDKEHDDYEVAIAIADYFCLYLEQITTQGESISTHSRNSWYRYARDVYSNSPLLQTYLEDKRDWYAPKFWDVVEGRETG